MKTFNKYSLYFLTAYALVLLVIGMLMWNSLAIIQKIIIIATCIVTLHEWEEQRFPGGFFDVMSRIWQIDLSNIDLHDMYAKPDIYIFFQILSFYPVQYCFLGYLKVLYI